MRVALESQDGRISYASATFYVGSSDWRLVNATLSPLETDDDARLGIAFQGPGDQADTLLYFGARHICLKMSCSGCLSQLCQATRLCMLP